MGIQFSSVPELKEAYYAGREFIVATGGNYSIELKEKALSFCDNVEERMMMRLSLIHI